MPEWEFRDPWFLLVAAAAPLIYWLASHSPSVVRYSSLTIADQSPRSLRARFVQAPAILLAVAVVLLSIALAGPRTPDAETKISREGLAILMVVDRSSSMEARDLVRDDASVDRLTVVKDVFRKFVLGGENAGAGRPDDLVGLIAFAGFADSLCPLTLDHGNLATLVGDLEIVHQRSEDGTAIGEGLGLAVERLRKSPAKSKIAILLTDGVNNAGAIEPLQAAELAARHDIRVYCIGAGTEGVAPVPVIDPFTGRTVLRQAYVEIDEATLREIAEKTGGRYYRATDGEVLAEIYQQIDRLERTKISELRFLQYQEHYGAFVIAGFVLLAATAVIRGTVLRCLP